MKMIGEIWKWEPLAECLLIGGKKREKRAISKNLKFLQEAKKFKEQERIVGVVCGGESIELRKEAARDIISEGVDTIVLQGLEQLQEKIRIDTLESLKELQVDKIIKGGEPIIVLQSIMNGVNQIIVEYPWKLAEEGNAVVWEWNWQEWTGDFKGISSLLNMKIKQRSLKDKEFSTLLEPISPNCQCYCCNNHTMAYIHHLIKCREMTANVLLTVHNVFQYQKFLKEINVAIGRNEFDKFVGFFREKNCL